MISIYLSNDKTTENSSEMVISSTGLYLSQIQRNILYIMSEKRVSFQSTQKYT